MLYCRRYSPGLAGYAIIYAVRGVRYLLARYRKQNDRRHAMATEDSTESARVSPSDWETIEETRMEEGKDNGTAARRRINPNSLASCGNAMGRRGAADEQAAAIAFLASHDASYITGPVLAVGGGQPYPF